MYVWPTPRPALKTAIAIVTEAFGEYAQVSANMPRQLPIRFIRVDRIGGSRPNPVTDIARILIECFGPDPETVESMCSTVDEAMHNAIGTIVGDVFIRDWTNINGPIRRNYRDLLSVSRMMVDGDLWLSTSTPAAAPPGS